MKYLAYLLIPLFDSVLLILILSSDFSLENDLFSSDDLDLLSFTEPCFCVVPQDLLLGDSLGSLGVSVPSSDANQLVSEMVGSLSVDGGFLSQVDSSDLLVLGLSSVPRPLLSGLLGLVDLCSVIVDLCVGVLSGVVGNLCLPSNFCLLVQAGPKLLLVFPTIW